MRINLHIERLVLEGLPISALEGAAVRQVVEAELTRLWSQTDPPLLRDTSAGVPALQGAAISIGATAGTSQLGGAIAQSLYGAIAK